MNKEDMIISLLKEIDENIDNVNDSEGTNANLEELTITSNGIYTPQDGVDGFSKVTAEFDTSSLPKVKVSHFNVNNACINNDGRWDGEKLIDTTKCTSFLQTFKDTKVTHLDLTNLDVSNVTTLRECFQGCTSLVELNVSNWNTSNVISLWYTFYGCKFRTIDVSNWNTANVTQMQAMFRNCSNLEYLDTTNWEAENFDYKHGIAELFLGSENVKSIVGNRDINDVITNNIKCFSNIKINIPDSSFSSTKLDRASIRALINGLADLTGSDAQILLLGKTLIAKLTEEDIAIATAKNWTIA